MDMRENLGLTPHYISPRNLGDSLQRPRRENVMWGQYLPSIGQEAPTGTNQSLSRLQSPQELLALFSPTGLHE